MTPGDAPEDPKATRPLQQDDHTMAEPSAASKNPVFDFQVTRSDMKALRFPSVLS